MTSILLTCEHTYKHRGEEDFYRGHRDEKRFPSIESALAWLKSEYGTRRAPMYVDLVAGGTKQVGWIYKHTDDEGCMWETWASFEQITPLYVQKGRIAA